MFHPSRVGRVRSVVDRARIQANSSRPQNGDLALPLLPNQDVDGTPLGAAPAHNSAESPIELQAGGVTEAYFGTQTLEAPYVAKGSSSGSSSSSSSDENSSSEDVDAGWVISRFSGGAEQQEQPRNTKSTGSSEGSMTITSKSAQTPLTQNNRESCEPTDTAAPQIECLFLLVPDAGVSLEKAETESHNFREALHAVIKTWFWEIKIRSRVDVVPWASWSSKILQRVLSGVTSATSDDTDTSSIESATVPKAHELLALVYSERYLQRVLSLTAEAINSRAQAFLEERQSLSSPNERRCVVVVAQGVGGLIVARLLKTTQQLEPQTANPRTRNGINCDNRRSMSAEVNCDNRKSWWSRSVPGSPPHGNPCSSDVDAHAKQCRSGPAMRGCLRFLPDRVFLLGCPLAAIMVCRHNHWPGRLQMLRRRLLKALPATVPIYNIFYPDDPFGCRFEPFLIDSRQQAEAVEDGAVITTPAPVWLPFWYNNSQRPHQRRARTTLPQGASSPTHEGAPTRAGAAGRILEKLNAVNFRNMLFRTPAGATTDVNGRMLPADLPPPEPCPPPGFIRLKLDAEYRFGAHIQFRPDAVHRKHKHGGRIRISRQRPKQQGSPSAGSAASASQRFFSFDGEAATLGPANVPHSVTAPMASGNESSSETAAAGDTRLLADRERRTPCLPRHMVPRPSSRTATTLRRLFDVLRLSSEIREASVLTEFSERLRLARGNGDEPEWPDNIAAGCSQADVLSEFEDAAGSSMPARLDFQLPSVPQSSRLHTTPEQGIGLQYYSSKEVALFVLKETTQFRPRLHVSDFNYVLRLADRAAQQPDSTDSAATRKSAPMRTAAAPAVPRLRPLRHGAAAGTVTQPKLSAEAAMQAASRFLMGNE